MRRRRGVAADFKREATRLVQKRGLPVTRAVSQLDVHRNVRRKWVGKFEAD